MILMQNPTRRRREKANIVFLQNSEEEKKRKRYKKKLKFYLFIKTMNIVKKRIFLNRKTKTLLNIQASCHIN